MVAPSFVNASTPQSGGGNTLAVNMPASIVAGNLLLVFLRNSQQSVALSSIPSGWTAATGLNVSNHTVCCFRWATGSEAASYTFTANALQSFSEGVCLQFTGGIGSGQPFDTGTGAPVTGRDIAGSVNTVSLGSITTTVNDTLLLYVDMRNNSTQTLSTSPSGMTNRASATSLIHFWTETKATAGSSGAKQGSMTASSLHFDSLMAILPAPSQTVSPGGIASTSAVGTPTVTAGTVTVSPGGINSAATVGTPTVTAGSVTVSPSGVDSSAQLGTPTVTAGQVTVNPAGIDATALLGTPTVVPGTVTVSPAGIDSTALLGTPTVVPGAFTVEPGGIDSTALLGTPTVLSGFVTISPPGIGPTSGVGTPTVEAETIVTGTVFNHETGDPVGPGVTVKLFDDNDVLVDSTTTDGSSVFTFYRPFGDTTLYWTLAEYELLGVQYHGVSDRGCPAV